MDMSLVELGTLIVILSLLSIPYLSLRAKSNTKKAFLELTEKNFSGVKLRSKALVIAGHIKTVELSVLFKNLYLGLLAYMIANIVSTLNNAFDAGEPLITNELVGLSVGAVLCLFFYILEKLGDIKQRKRVDIIERQLGVADGLTVQKLLSIDDKLIEKLRFPMFKI